MGSTSRTGRASVNPSAPEAFGICDRCGFQYNLSQLQYQFDWQGTSLINKRLRVCSSCMDVPFEQNRTIILPPDPPSIYDPRPEYYIDEPNIFTLAPQFLTASSMMVLLALFPATDVFANFEAVGNFTATLTQTGGGGGLNTALKRRTAAGLSFRPVRGPRVTPDASKGLVWRYAVAAKYNPSGTPPVIDPGDGDFVTASQRRRAAGLSFRPVRGPRVIPDAAKPALWRSGVAARYYAASPGGDAGAIFAAGDIDVRFTEGAADLAGSPVSIASVLSVTRAAPAWYTDSAGIMTEFAADTARIGDRGVLVEGSAQNLAIRSEEFDTASWSKSNAAVVANAINSPTGFLTADKLNETTSSGNHRVTQSLGTLAAGRFVLSVYAKAGERSQLDLAISVGSNFIGNIFDLSTGTVVRNDDGGSQINRRRRGIEALGNGWYRCWIAGQTTASLGHSAVIGVANGGVNSYSGAAGNGIHIWGAQYEAVDWLDGPSSYIKTEATTVMRPADVPSFTDLSWIGGTSDTIYVEWIGRKADNITICAIDAANDKALTQDLIFRPRLAGAKPLNGGHGAGLVMKAAAKLATNDFRLSCNGGAVATDTSEPAPGTVAAVRLGINLAGGAALNGHIRRFSGWKTGLIDADLRTVSAQIAPGGVTDITTLLETQLGRATGLMVHWSEATYEGPGLGPGGLPAGEQWSEGNEPLTNFAPTGGVTALEIADDWLDAAEIIGATYICPVIMHHSGFTLWTSAVAPRHVGLTAWGAIGDNGEFATVLYERATERGFKVLPYFSIWNRKFELDNPSFDNSAGRRAYTQLVKDLLTEIHARMPGIVGLWTDGWLWQVGYVRVSWQDIREHIASLWPNAILVENSHEFTYEHTDGITYEDGGSSPMPSSNEEYAEVNTTGYSNSSPASHWFYNSDNQQTPGSGESPGASTLKTAAAIIAARTSARNGHAWFQLNFGGHADGKMGAAELAIMATVGTG